MSQSSMAVAGQSANDRMKAQARTSRAQDVNSTLNFLRSRFAFERLLARVSAAGYADRWMLKGGVLMLALGTGARRSTSDMDFTLRGGPDGLEAVVRALGDICAARLPAEDGIEFAIDHAHAPRLIGEAHNERTARVEIAWTLHCDRPISGKFNIDATALELDHEPVMREWVPTVRGYEPLVVPSYSWEVVVAEKLHAVMTGSMRNPRLRDYGDLIVLSRSGKVDTDRARREVERVFAARGPAGAWNLDALGLSLAFARERQANWKGTVSSIGYKDHVPESLSSAIDEVRELAASVTPANMPEPPGSGPPV